MTILSELDLLVDDWFKVIHTAPLVTTEGEPP